MKQKGDRPGRARGDGERGPVPAAAESRMKLWRGAVATVAQPVKVPRAAALRSEKWLRWQILLQTFYNYIF